MRTLILAFFILPVFVTAQDTFAKGNKNNTAIDPTELNINSNVQGTLYIPEGKTAVPLVILLTGSGPNDRNGNSTMTRNDSHKQLAHALLKNGIATYRYDKRTFTQIKKRKIDPNTSFDHFVQDAQDVVYHFQNDNRFSSIILAGHSQGSLVAMLAINNAIDGFISLAGPAETIDKTIVRQIAAQAPGLDKEAQAIFEKMKTQDKPVTDVQPYLMSILNPGIQPFMKSWMVYDPVVEIKKLTVPVLLINGTRDRQVDPADAQMLHSAKPDAQLLIINDMDHLFKRVGADDVVAAKSYNDPSFPLHEALVPALVAFINSIKK